MFFTYQQNNSGGYFHFDKEKGITRYLIIEADNYHEANNKAERIGIYFNGLLDCKCCGKRWYKRNNDDGCELPSLYGEVLEGKDLKKLGITRFMEDGYEVCIHYKDGSKEWL